MSRPDAHHRALCGDHIQPECGLLRGSEVAGITYRPVPWGQTTPELDAVGSPFGSCALRLPGAREKSGIDLAIHYFASQPWPFPNSMMIAFHADYAGGDIQVDGVEIADAQWFDVDALPNLPGKFSISRRLIESALAELGGHV